MKQKGFFAALMGSVNVDCDASVILCDANGKLLDNNVKKGCVYFGNKIALGGAIKHSGDNLTGSGAGDDEQIHLDLSSIPDEVQKVVFVVNIYEANVKKQHFGMIENAYIRLVDLNINQEICKFNLTDNYTNMEGLIVAEVYRENGIWKFNAVGDGIKQASTLTNLIKLYQ